MYAFIYELIWKYMNSEYVNLCMHSFMNRYEFKYDFIYDFIYDFDKFCASVFLVPPNQFFFILKSDMS